MLVIGSSLFFLLLSALLVSALGRIIWAVDERLTSGGMLFGSVALIGIACQALSLFGRSRTMTAVVYLAAAIVSCFTFGAALFSKELFLIRGVAALFGVAFAFVAWSYSRWGERLRDWKWGRDHSAVLPDSGR